MRQEKDEYTNTAQKAAGSYLDATHGNKSTPCPPEHSFKSVLCAGSLRGLPKNAPTHAQVESEVKEVGARLGMTKSVTHDPFDVGATWAALLVPRQGVPNKIGCRTAARCQSAQRLCRHRRLGQLRLFAESLQTSGQVRWNQGYPSEGN
ncbi:hypothetical protein MRX96_044580 [Rhipicephalus microplus]